MEAESGMMSEKASRRAGVLASHIQRAGGSPSSTSLLRSACLQYSPPAEVFAFDCVEMRKLMDGGHLAERDWLLGLMCRSQLFNPMTRGEKVFVSPDYNQSMEQQREITWKRITYFLQRGVFRGWLTERGAEAELRMLALFDAIGLYDHSLAIKIAVHFSLFGAAILHSGTQRHHHKWLSATENYSVKGCFAMSELGHGSNVRGVETVATYVQQNKEFLLNTPCESAQKYWIGGAANDATHAVVFSQLVVDGVNHGVHAFIVQLRDEDGSICSNIRIADCGHKTGLNGVDNGRIWFDNVRVPRENFLNSVADVTEEGRYVSPIKDPDQRFAAFLSPLTSSRVSIAVAGIYSAKVALAIAIRYSLTRRAFSFTSNGPEVRLLDYPSHQKRLLPLLAKTYAMSLAAYSLKLIYVNRNPELIKEIHVYSSAFKATMTWHNMRTLQECREACGGQGLKSENRIGQMKSEYDVQCTFEGDNNVLMQQVSKALFVEHMAVQKFKKPFKGLGLEHLNSPCPVIPSNLDSSTLRSTQFQIDIFCLRERDLLTRFVNEVREHQSNGCNKEQAFVLSHNLAGDLGRAFSDRAILKAFIQAEAPVASGPLKDVLGLVRSMYALQCMEEDVAFIRYGYLSVDNAAAVRNEVNKLCGELRPHALALVSSFGIPDAFLSPIAFDWIHANSY